jgi:hypothetical protein
MGQLNLTTVTDHYTARADMNAIRNGSFLARIYGFFPSLTIKSFEYMICARIGRRQASLSMGKYIQTLLLLASCLCTLDFLQHAIFRAATQFISQL